MAWYVYVIIAMALAYVGWLHRETQKVKTDIGKLFVQVARVEADLQGQRNECAARLDWLRGMDAKMDKNAENIAQILGFVKRKE